MNNWNVVNLLPRPYANFDEYLFEKRLWSFGKGKSALYPCMKCNSTGTIRDPSFQPDPVEGYKMADIIKCTACDGSGISDAGALRGSYEKEIADWKVRNSKDIDKRKSQLAVLKKVKNVLSKEEMKILKELA